MVRPPETRRPDLVALDDQISAYLRGRGVMGSMTPEVWKAMQDPECAGFPHTSCHHVDYGLVRRRLWHLARADAVDVFQDPAGRRAGTWWVWRALPVRVPGATIGHG